MRRALLILALAGGAALGACGGSGSSSTSSTPTVAATTKTLTTPLKVNPTPTTTPSATITATTPATTPTTTGETQTGGAGDEQPIEVPATFTLGAGGFSPPTISVPAFLTIRLSVTSRDAKAHDVTVQTDHGSRSLHVNAGGSVSVLLTGLKRGTYAVTADGGAAKAQLVVGVNPGP